MRFDVSLRAEHAENACREKEPLEEQGPRGRFVRAAGCRAARIDEEGRRENGQKPDEGERADDGTARFLCGNREALDEEAEDGEGRDGDGEPEDAKVVHWTPPKMATVFEASALAR